jgi:hypothetical protein
VKEVYLPGYNLHGQGDTRSVPEDIEHSVRHSNALQLKALRQRWQFAFPSAGTTVEDGKIKVQVKICKGSEQIPRITADSSSLMHRRGRIKANSESRLVGCERSPTVAQIS